MFIPLSIAAADTYSEEREAENISTLEVRCFVHIFLSFLWREKIAVRTVFQKNSHELFRTFVFLVWKASTGLSVWSHKTYKMNNKLQKL